MPTMKLAAFADVLTLVAGLPQMVSVQRTTSGDRTPWLKEGGKGTLPIAFHFQLRPNPLTE